MSIEAKLAELGIILPEAAAPVAAYVPVVIAGGLAYVSGQVSSVDGHLLRGRLGEDLGLEQGVMAARACFPASSAAGVHVRSGCLGAWAARGRIRFARR